jgi:hypothetical protein
MSPQPWGGSRIDAGQGAAPGMTNGIAIGIVLVVTGVFAADLLYFGWDLHIFLGREFLDLIELLAIWR